MSFVDDLIIGQLDISDTVPVNYCTPNAYFQGLNFQGTDHKEAVYKSKAGSIPKFDSVNNFSTVKVLSRANEMIRKSYTAHIVPTSIEDTTFIGFGHKLQASEISNQLIAFNDAMVLKLDHPDVAKIIRNNHSYLKGTSLIKNGIIDYEAANKPIAVYDEMNNMYVYSLVNGAKAEFISKLLELDLQIAYNTVTDKIKTPINENQFVALISLAFDIGHKKFATSKIAKCLNNGDYQCVTYFMEFSEVQRKKSKGISTVLFNRRLAEASLFSRL